MKTIANKIKLALALTMLAWGVNAQTAKLKKACIKMEKDDNGKVTKIDTCVTAATDVELQQKLNALGIVDMPELPPLPEIDGVPPVPPVPPMPPAPPAPGERPGKVTISKTIIIDDGGDDNKSGRHKRVTVTSSSDGKGEQVIIMDENGKIISSGSDGAVVIKEFKKGDKLDPETEKILKENNIEIKNDGEGKQVIIKDKSNKKNKSVKVYILKTDVETLSEADKKQLAPAVTQSIAKADPFDNLNIAPNPTDDACTVSYQSKSSEPLQVKVYDTNGKTVYTETDKNIAEHVNKTLSLKDFGAGTYFIHLTQGKQSEIRKIVLVKQ